MYLADRKGPGPLAYIHKYVSQYLFVFAFRWPFASFALRCDGECCFVFTTPVKMTTNGDHPAAPRPSPPAHQGGSTLLRRSDHPPSGPEFKASQPCAESFVQCPFNYTHDFRFLRRRLAALSPFPSASASTRIEERNKEEKSVRKTYGNHTRSGPKSTAECLFSKVFPPRSEDEGHSLWRTGSEVHSLLRQHMSL